MSSPYIPDWHDCNALCTSDHHAVLTYANIDGALDAEWLRVIEFVFSQDGWQVIEARRAIEVPNLSPSDARQKFEGYERDGDSASDYRYPVLVIIRPAEGYR